jgi:hypothetical protein
MPMKWGILLLLAWAATVRAQSIPLAPFSAGAALTQTPLEVDGAPAQAWQASTQNRVMLLKPTSGATMPTNGTVYLELNYLDKGYGRLNVTCPGLNGTVVKPDKFTRVVLTDSGKWVTSYERLTGLAPGNVPDLSASVEKDPKNPLSRDNALVLASAALKSEPFADAHFQYLLDEAWKRPYAGPSAPGIDNRTLKGKIMAGYQGWFRTPNDPYDSAWVHWGDIYRGHFTVDIWPDVSGYAPEALDKAGDLKTLSGKTAYLFSPAWPEVVRTQFAWMRQNQIDGVFAQRFCDAHLPEPGPHHQPDWVLGNIRAAANEEGRIWAVEYDVSGCPDDKLLDMIKHDWAWMIDSFGIRKDPAYAHENGKLVVFVWGMPLPDRHISLGTANAVVDFLKNDPVYGGNYVIGGIQPSWRTLDAGWQRSLRKFDALQPWMSTDYARDIADFKKLGVQYYPHVKPGFSWANMFHYPTGATEAYTPRDGGRYYESLFSKAVQAGVDRLFVGMFDEYDEGTAILSMSDDPPPTPRQPGTALKLFDNAKEQGKPLILNRPQIELKLDGTAPAKNIPPQNMAIMWEGQLFAPATGTYQFEIEGAPGDTCSFSLDNTPVLKNIKLGGPVPAKTAPLILTAGKPAVYRLDYLHGTATGTVRLFWQSPSLPRQEIPASALVDAWGRFVTPEGHPSDWWLKLTAEAKEMLTGRRAPTDLTFK